MVLWTLGLLALLGTRVIGQGRTEVRLATNIERAAKLQAEADGAVQSAIFHRLPGTPDPWPADDIWRPDPLAADRGEGRVEIRIRDESGQINPNLATPDLWVALLQTLGLDRDAAANLAGALVAWRTPGMGTTSNTLYARDNRPWGPPGAPFETLGELGLVYGMTPALLAELRPHLSLSQPTDPDPTRADPVVQRALSLAASTTATITGAPVAVRDRPSSLHIEALATNGPTHAGRRATILIDPSDGAHPARVLEWERY